ncbi:uncharacterized protein LOC120143514 isoform X2 [Hibiscus syriacus]|uniref:uncharacterized protein LOC120143514 isoform X2 n=1 Tax=Hibiscus syriacus TaxID=106335 RepID=UPI0019227D62|nr:uncharacterized protein LOC120143514 isoform X2 [Hibiscus syriacus]
MSGYNKERPRTIRLFCPSVSKLVRFVACDSHKLDVGSISRLFGLDPSTVKLNGHFISRGVDLVSSSVTWRSLLSFFSSKGLSTGTDGDHKRALIVDGKLCKVGIKTGNPGINDAGITAKRHLKDICSVENKRLRESRSAGSHDGGECSNGIGFKRKSSMENHSLLKKLKINETNSELKGKGNNKVSPVYSTPFKCSYLSGNMKRGREDEMIAGVPSKRISSG